MHPLHLRVRKNTAEGSILLRLPPELIESIMYITAGDQFLERTPLGSWRTDSSRYASIRLCHICRYWRQVGLDCPSVWSYIDSKRTPLVGYLIGLSRNASLTVSVITGDWCEPEDDVAIAQIFGEIHRIKELHLTVHKMDVKSSLSGLPLPLVAPRLDFLSLKCSERSCMPDELFYSTPNCTNHIKSLSLTDINIGNLSSHPHILRSLRCLRIFPWESQGTNLSELIDILILCPELIEFVFHDNHPTPTSIYGVSDRRIVTLPRLRWFQLSCSINAGIFLLNRLSVPLDVSLSMLGPYVDNLHPSSEQSIPETFVAAYDSLKITTSTSIKIESETILPCRDAHDEVDHRNFFYLYFTELRLRSLPPILINLLPRLRHLELEEYFPGLRPAESLILFFTSLCKLENLKILFRRSGSAISVMDALLDSRTGYRRLWPNLQAITFRGIKFESPEGNIVLSKLASFLKDLENSSERLAMLDISGCSGTPSEALQLLQPHVHTLCAPEERLP